MRIALLSNVTADVLAGMIRKEHDLWLAPGFGSWMEIALQVPDDLKRFNPDAVFLLLDEAHAGCDGEKVDAAVASLEAELPLATVIVPDLADLEDEVGGFRDERMWKLASMPWSLKGLDAIRGEIDRLLRAMTGARRKVLALDLDGTLWKGVVGEDGVSGISPNLGFQLGIRKLRERGILLVALSRNNAADVDPVWDDPRMALRREDFADMRIDWNDKAENLAACARFLNLGTDSFVFVDDNPAERARMKAALPEVDVPDWPVSARRLARIAFPRMRITEEDRVRTERYRSEGERKRLRSSLPFGDYLKSLEMRIDVHPVREGEVARVAQLSQKSNQFNVCTNRYTADEAAAFAADPERLFVSVHVADRFGDMGLVAFVNAKICAASAAIEDWVMSCRAMNRRIEFEVWERVKAELVRRGVESVTAVWRKTQKNAPVRDLYAQLGFAAVGSTEAETAYSLCLVS